jgi:hypothetical protein
MSGVVPLIGLLLGVLHTAPPADLPKLDVPAAIRALETQQVYQAPGVSVAIDLAAVQREMAPNTKLLIAPFTEPFKAGNNYANGDAHYKDVYLPLLKWAQDKKVELVTVEGLETSYGPSSLSELREQTAYMDVTGPTLAAVRKAKKAPIGDTYPVYAVREPTSGQLADLVGKLRQAPIHNAPGRDDQFTLSVKAIKDQTGLSLRVVALPPLRPGEPFVDYAPALAKEFPDDVVVVAQGYWAEIAGKDPERLASARNYAFGRFEYGTFQQGGSIDNRVRTIVQRIDELSRRKPFGRPQPKTYDPAETITRYTPWAWGASAFVLGGGALTGWGLRRFRRNQTERAALHKATVQAYAKISELGTALLEHQTPAAAERFSTARDLFEQAKTAEAMAEVEKIAVEGLASL